ncbi:MAG: prepilin-type N-terminal cleavage/methylation domain-containing protein [Chthoniobacterales bacterium]
MKRYRHAFTLLETVVALGIFSIAILGCIKAIDTINGLVSDLRMESQARRSLENHAMELRGLKPNAVRSVSGNTPDKITIKDEQNPVEDKEAGLAIDAGVSRVKMTASWKTALGEQSLSNTIYIRREN